MQAGQILELLRWRSWPVVSIYVPATPTGPGLRQAPIRLKNALNQAWERVRQAWIHSAGASRILRPGWVLLDDGLFWLRQGNGVVLFLSPDHHEVHRLATAVPERLVVADRPHVKPLLTSLTGDGRFHVLAVSQKDVRLLEASRDGAQLVEASAIPESLRVALRFDVVETAVQFHTLPPPGGLPGPGRPIIHGHSQGTSAVRKTQLTEFLRQVARGVEGHLHDRGVPVVFAGDESIFGVFRAVSALRGLVETPVAGNADGLSPAELHRRAWPLVEPIFTEDRREAFRRYRERDGTGLTVSKIGDVVRAAHDGLIDTLFASTDEEVWGWYHPPTRRVLLGRDLPGEALGGGEDLIDRAAVETALRHGTVYLEGRGGMPAGSPVAALLRYAAPVAEMA